MMMTQKLLDLLHEAPASKRDIMEALDLAESPARTLIRRMVKAKEIELREHPARNLPALYHPLVERTSLPESGKDATGSVPAQIWNPATDEKPDWLRRGA